MPVLKNISSRFLHELSPLKKWNQQQYYMFDLSFLFSQKNNRLHLVALSCVDIFLLQAGRSDGVKISSQRHYSTDKQSTQALNNEQIFKHTVICCSVSATLSVVNLYRRQNKSVEATCKTVKSRGLLKTKQQ